METQHLWRRNVATQLFAKLEGKKGENKIIFTDEENLQKIHFFSIPQIQKDKIIEFEAEKKIESDEWFYIIIDGEHREMITPYTDCSQNTADINTVLANDYQNIETIFRVDIENEEQKIVFQKITNSKRIQSKTFISFYDHPKVIEQKNSIDFAERIDAYFDGKDKIYFRNFSTIRSLFNGIEDYYREATNDEVKKIIQNEMLQCAKDVKVGIRNRKRIAAILSDESIKLDNQDFQNAIKQYANKYPEILLTTNEGEKYIINNDKDLGTFLALVSGRYYTSEITGEKMEAKETVKLTHMDKNNND